MTRPLMCPTCQAPIPPDAGHGVVACPYCNTAIDRGPAEHERDAPFLAGPSAFLPSHHEKPLWSPSPLTPPPPANQFGVNPHLPPSNQFGVNPHLPPPFMMAPLPQHLLQPSPRPSRGQRSSTIIVIIVVTLIAVGLMSLLPFLIFLL